jgi:glyoxylase-like metal-dependent hydrolase (beta-lactamase superfamily II)
MKIHHLNCGTLRPPLSKWVTGHGGLMVCHCLLIETEAGLVLVDTGFGLGAVAHPVRNAGAFLTYLGRPAFALAETAARQVEALGHTTSDVRHIVLTHLDPDHCGGIADFPKAIVHVHQDELEAALRPHSMNDRMRYRKPLWEHGPQWQTHRTEGEEWFGFQAARDLPGLPSEILVVPLVGHTRGHIGVVVDRGSAGSSRWLLHAGDAYTARTQLDPNPSCPPIIRATQNFEAIDRNLFHHNISRLAELSKNPDVEIVSAHELLDLERVRRDIMSE